MADTIASVTDADFDRTLVQAAGPVLVDFWAEWAGPSKLTNAALANVAPDYAGRIAFVKLNIDQNPATPPKYDVKAVPTLLIFKRGAVVGTKIGALSEGQLREFVDANL